MNTVPSTSSSRRDRSGRNHGRVLGRRREPIDRRGNTLVLTAAILVLLVIIASAYLSRAQGDASMGTSMQLAGQRDQINDNLLGDVADIIGLAVFPPSIDTTGVPLLDPTGKPFAVNSNHPLQPRDPNAPRMGVGNLRDANGDGIVESDYPYTAVANSSKPFTNLPDDQTSTSGNKWAKGDGAPLSTLFLGIGNPLGFPGFNDNRYLSDPEPFRLDLDNDGITDRFVQWTHLANIGRPDNSFRIIGDISDVTGSLVSNLNVPAEQWLAPRFNYTTNSWEFVPAGVSVVAGSPGHATMAGDTGFMGRWNDWFNFYEDRYRGVGGAIPANYYKQSDLNIDGSFGTWAITGVPQESAQAEFIAGTARHTLNRVLADADGDDFTDSYWFYCPSTIDRNVMRIMAVRVIDNNSMVNVNTGSRFVWNDPVAAGAARTATNGGTPADVALIGSAFNINPNLPADLNNLDQTNVGFLDNPQNHSSISLYPGSSVGFLSTFWDDQTASGQNLAALSPRTWLREMRVKGNPDFTAWPFELATQRDRLTLWKFAGLRPLDPIRGLTPFTLADEIELRMFNGLNYPWVSSRLENTLTFHSVGNSGNPTAQPRQTFIRGTIDAEETVMQLDSSPGNPQVANLRRVRDNRHRMTTYNAVRNDIMPIWLWPRLSFTDYWVDDNPANGVFDPAEIQAAKEDFRYETQKIDLRQPFVDTNGDGVVDAAEQRDQNRDLARRMIAVFEKSFLRQNGANVWSYFGNNAADRIKAQNLARSLTANILCWRDNVVNPTLPALPQMAETDLPIHPNGPGRIDELVDPSDNNRWFLGQEAQPFIMEAFIAHVYGKSRVATAWLNDNTLPQPANPFQIPPPFDGAGEHFVDSSSDSTTVVVVQIANPYNKPIVLDDFQIRVFDQSFSFYAKGVQTGQRFILGPSTEERPCTAIVYAVIENFSSDAGNDVQFRTKMLDFLDIQDGDLFQDAATPYLDTIVVDATKVGAAGTGWRVDDKTVYKGDKVAVELVRSRPGFTAVVVDRIDTGQSGSQLEEEFLEKVSELSESPHEPPTAAFSYDPSSQTGEYSGIRIQQDDYYMVWARTARNWAWDVNGNLVIDPDERNPRYVFADRPDSDTSQRDYDGYPETPTPTGKYRGDSFKATLDGIGQFVVPPYAGNPDLDPDITPWAIRDYIDPFKIARRRKPTFFPTQTVYDISSNTAVYDGFVYAGTAPGSQKVNFGDKSGGLRDPDPQDASSPRDSDYYAAQGYDFALQMNHKDGDFDRIGELLDVFLWGPVVRTGGANIETEWTFSELMSAENNTDPFPAGEGVMVNRLNITPTTPVLPNINHFTPALPAGTLHFDGFVCDNRGIRNPDMDLDGTVEPSELDYAELLRYRLANGYTGRGTPGLININTAAVEVIRAAPFMTRLVHETAAAVNNPFVRVAEAISQYREALGFQVSAGASTPALPGYADRGAPNAFFPGMRTERGIEAIGELLLLLRPSPLSIGSPTRVAAHDSVRVDFAGVDPYYMDADGNGTPERGYKVDLTGGPDLTLYQARLGTDMNDVVLEQNLNWTLPPVQAQPDLVAGDAEERNLLFSGISNLITTRSDTFTVYVKIRTFRQNPETGRWDATDPQHIIDDSRYVFLVDRSAVNSSLDKPKILYLEKLPN